MRRYIWIFLMVAVAAGCISNPKGLDDSQSPTGGDQAGSGGDGDTTNMGPIAVSGSAWAVLVAVWLLTRRRQRRQNANIKAVAKAIAFLPEGQRDDLLSDIKTHLPDKRQWDRAIGGFRRHVTRPKDGMRLPSESAPEMVIIQERDD